MPTQSPSSNQQRPADVVVSHSEKKLSGFRLISQGQVKVWKAMLISVFLAGLVGAFAFIAGFDQAREIGQASEAAVLPASIGWYQGWTSRQPVIIGYAGREAVAGYQIRVDLAYDPDMQQDFDDVRFTLGDGITSLAYWLEDKADSKRATFWINIPHIGSSGSQQTIFAYYGNPDAQSASSGKETFVFFDDFSQKSASLGGNWRRVVVDRNFDGAHDVVIEDINRDGRPDLVADAYRAHDVVWYEQPADPVRGQWTRHTIDPQLTNPHDVQVGDIDQDGQNDVVAVSLSDDWTNYNKGDGELVWYRKPADPRGAWTKTVIAASGSEGLLGARSIGLGDIDGDGDFDIAVAVDAQTYQTKGRVYWYENPGGSAALNPARWRQFLIDATPGNGADVQVADIDGDGNQDLVYAGNNGNPENTFVYFAPDNPTVIAGWSRVAIAGESYHVFPVDFDADGDIDVLRANAGGGSVSWLENPSAQNARVPGAWREYVIEKSSETRVANLN